MNPQSIYLTEKAAENLEELKAILPDVESEFLVETALQLTANLYKKASEGAVIQVKSDKGKVEELRFKTRKESKRKSKNPA